MAGLRHCSSTRRSRRSPRRPSPRQPARPVRYVTPHSSPSITTSMDSRSAAPAALSVLKGPKQMADGGEQELAAGGTAGQSAEPAAASAGSSVAEETEMNLPLTLVFLFGFSLALPVLSVVSSMPGGL